MPSLPRNSVHVFIASRFFSMTFVLLSSNFISSFSRARKVISEALFIIFRMEFIVFPAWNAWLSKWSIFCCTIIFCPQRPVEVKWKYWYKKTVIVQDSIANGVDAPMCLLLLDCMKMTLFTNNHVNVSEHVT